MSLIHEVSEIFKDKVYPKRWITIELNRVVKIQNGYAFKSSNFNSDKKGMPLIRIRDIKNSTMETFFNGEILDEYTVVEDDLLIGMDGDFNSNLWKGKPALLNQRVCRLIPNEEIIVKKLLYYGLPEYLIKINENTSSTTVKHLSSKSIGEIPFPLPPLSEQNRIVAKLDTLFTQLDIIKTSMENVPVLLKDFRQQVLTQAVTGKLTEEWRKGKKLGEWSYELAKDCCEKVQSGGTPKGSNFDTSGIPFLKVYNIVNNKIDFEYNPQYVSEVIQNSQIKKSICFPGDVIMNIVGPPLNKIAIIPEDYPEWNLNQAITLFRTKEYLSNRFLYYFFCEGSSLNSLINETKGVVGQVNISLSQCRNFSIPVPSPKEQKEIVSKVESLFAKADAIEQQYKTLKAKIDTLPQALLHKAFKGELSEQLDSDGDARELLEKIQELKEVTTKVAKNTKLEKLKSFNKKTKNYLQSEGVLGMVAEGK